MEPTNIIQQIQTNNENPIFENNITDQQTAQVQRRASLQQMDELQQQKEDNIVAEFSKKIPSLSLKLEKQLQDGPPAELGKFQKIRWSSDMNKRIKEEKKQERAMHERQIQFFAPARELLDDMTRRKVALPENASIKQITTTFTDCTKNASTVDTQKLIKDSTGVPAEVTSLKDIFTELSSFTAQTFTEEQAKNYTARYHALGMEVNAATSRYLDEAGTMDPASCYVILFHSITQMLQYHLNTIGSDKVDTLEFSKLYALAAASGLAANTMVLSQDYQTKRKNHLEQLAAKAAEKESALREKENIQAARRLFLHQGISASGPADVWPLAPYADMAETLLGEDLYNLSDKDLGLAIQRMEENLESNTVAVHMLYHSHSKGKPALERLEDVAIQEILLNVGSSLLTERLEVSSAPLFHAMTQFTEAHRDDIAIYENRINQLKAMPPLDLLFDSLSCSEITNMIYAQKDSDAFYTVAEDLQQQAQKNIDIAKELIAEKITFTNQKDALKALIDRIGQSLLLGAPSVVFIETEHFLNFLPLFAPQTAYNENTLRQQIRDAGIDSCWIFTVAKYLATANLSDDQQAQELGKLKEYIDTNQKTFDTELEKSKRSSVQWQMLLQWQNENIILSPDIFTQSLHSFLLQDEFKSTGDLTKAEYESREAATAPPTLKKNKFSNVQLLQNKDLCHWQGFGGLLDGEEAAVMNALEQALQENLLSMPVLENIHTLNDLELLPLQKYTSFLTLLRSNIAKALVEWKNINTLHPQEVRRRLLKKLICGNLTRDNIPALVAEEESLLKKQENAETLKFFSFMGRTVTTTGDVRYLHLKETKSTSLTGQASRAIRRKERFQIAKNVWDTIRNENLEKLMQDYWISAQGQENPISFIQNSMKDSISSLKSELKAADPVVKDEINAKIQSIQRLDALIRPLKTKSCEREFMLRGMEDELLSFTKAGNSFTSQEIENYNQTLLTLEKTVIPRYAELDRALKRIFGNNSDQVQKYHDRAKKLLTGLEPLDGSDLTEEQQRENRARFGVASWPEALAEITKLLLPKNEALRLQAENAATLFETRSSQLNTYKGGILKPFHDVIMQNPESFQSLMTGEEDGVSHYLSLLEKQFKNPYEALIRYNPEGTFAKEFILEKQSLFWNKTNTSLEFWKKEAEGYYEAYCTYEVGGRSINSRYLELSKSNTTLAPYLMQIIFANNEGISMLLSSNDKELNHMLNAYENRVVKNNAALDTFISTLKNNSTVTQRTGFILYLQTKIPYMEAEDFQTNLTKWWNDFRDLDAITQEETKKSEQILSKRAQTMLDIESKKQRGIEADQDVRISLEKIQNQVKCAPSPVLLALGQNQIIDEKSLDTKKKEIFKKYTAQPDIIQNILLESSLSGTTTEQLGQEASWLISTYEKITTTGFTVGDSSVHIEGDVADELLMVVFAKWKTSIGNSQNDKSMPLPEITVTQLQDNLHALSDSHRLLQELSEITIQDAGLSMERDHLVETLAAGIYTMEKEEFDKLISGRTSYIKASALALSVFLEETAEFGAEQLALCSGLREYFHEDLLKGEGELNLPTLRKQTKVLLKHKHIRQFLVNSSSLMENLSSTDEIRVTSSHHTLAQKHDLESYLSSLQDNEAFNAYTQLNLAQRQIFAMALSAPGQEELRLPTARFLKNEKQVYATRIQMQAQLQEYINHDAFTPIVDYTRALSQLKNPDGTLNKEAFQRAMDFTNVVVAQHMQQLPVDWNRLGDSVSTYSSAKRLTGQTADMKQLTVTSPEEFLQKLDTADTENKNAQSLKEKLHSLTQHQLQLLVYALTDRTILDRTTKITAWDRANGKLHGYANSEKREDMMELLLHDTSLVTKDALSSQTLSAAMASLMSYQLRDDVPLTGRSLHKNDFAANALQRKTTIDWNLLSEAFSFIHEIEQEAFRLTAIRQTDVLILESKNESAIAEYKEQQNANLSTQEDFENYLKTQAEKDGMAALYAGYQQLNQQERTLFIKALTQRHLLDISKKDINLNRVGLAEREYADAKARNALLDEYIETSLTKEGTVTLDENAYRQAVYMTLSTQISDDVDFSQMKEQSLATYLTSFSNPFKSIRQTAVDWKLVQRALQFVHRASNENDIFHQDRELYVSQGNLLNTGHFTFDSTHLRKNIHSSGNRFSRYLRRRTQDVLLDQIPAYLKPLLSQAIRLGRAALPAAYADQITRLGIFDDNEESSTLEKASTISEWEDSFYKDFLKKSTINYLGKEKENDYRDNMETLSNSITYLQAAATTGNVIRNFYQLNQAQINANQTAMQDKKLTEEAAMHQTAEQQELSNKALERNLRLQEQGSTKSQERQVDTIIDTIAEVIGTAAIEEELLQTAVTEAGKFINFIRNYINDKSSVVTFFKNNGELDKLRIAYATMEWDGEKEELDDIELIRQMKGYENYTELANFVGLNITRSLLFCASKYNQQKHLRYLSVATLATINMTDAIGHQDAETAENVFNALMGSDYR